MRKTSFLLKKNNTVLQMENWKLTFVNSYLKGEKTFEILHAHRPHEAIQLVFSIITQEMMATRIITFVSFDTFYRLLVPTEKAELSNL